MPVDDQAVAFVAWLHMWGYVGRHSCHAITEFAGWWANEAKVARASDAEFLAALKRHPAIAYSRDRLRDPSGRVLCLESGSPARQIFYTVSGEKPVSAAVPHGRLTDDQDMKMKAA